MSDFKNKNVFISGISRGIGKAIALKLAEQGCNIFGVSKSMGNLKKLEIELNNKNIKTQLFSGNVENYEEMKTIAEKILSNQTIDILINNAGLGIAKNFVNYSYEEFDRLFRTNVYGVFNLTHLFLPGMIKQNYGDIVIISSLAGKNGFAGGTGYSASKFALTGFAQSLMLEVRKYNVRVCIIHPGSVNTDMITEFHPENLDRERILQPDDIAETVLTFLKLPRRSMISELEIRPTNPR